MLASLDHCPHCNYGKKKDKKRKGGKAKKATRYDTPKKEIVRERWRQRELWVKTRPSEGDQWEEPEERIRVLEPSKIKGGSLKKAKRTSGQCPNCGRELYDWEERCSRCGERA